MWVTICLVSNTLCDMSVFDTQQVVVIPINFMGARVYGEVRLVIILIYSS